MNRTARIAILVISVAVFCYAGLGHVLGQTHEERAYKSLTVYGEVLQKIQQDYVDDPNMHLVTAGALHGLLESLDPQSSYLTPREYAEYKQKTASTNPGDTGLTLSKRYGYVIVVSVLPESPAEKAGIRSGDIFESVAGFTTREMSVGQAMNLLRGQPGGGVKVGVIRRGKNEPENVDIVREKLGPAKIVGQKTDPDILALRLTTLAAGCGKTRRTQSDFGSAELWTRTGLGGPCGRAFVYFEWQPRNAARANGFSTDICRRAQQGDLEGPRFGPDRRHDFRSGGSAGFGNCEYASR